MAYLIGISWTVVWVWLIVVAFKSEQIVWGVAIIIFPVSAYLYGILNWSKASTPFILLLILTGLVFTISPEEIAQIRASA